MGLHLNGRYVLHGLGMPLGNPTVSIETRASYGAHVLHYLGEFDNIGQLVSNLGTGTECTVVVQYFEAYISTFTFVVCQTEENENFEFISRKYLNYEKFLTCKSENIDISEILRTMKVRNPGGAI